MFHISSSHFHLVDHYPVSQHPTKTQNQILTLDFAAFTAPISNTNYAYLCFLTILFRFAFIIFVFGLRKVTDLVGLKVILNFLNFDFIFQFNAYFC